MSWRSDGLSLCPCNVSYVCRQKPDLYRSYRYAAQAPRYRHVQGGPEARVLG